MCDIRLFRRAYLEYRAAENLLRIPENDEAYMNTIAYHLQQAVGLVRDSGSERSIYSGKLRQNIPVCL